MVVETAHWRACLAGHLIQFIALTVAGRAVHAGSDESGAGGQLIAGRDLHGHGSLRPSLSGSPPLSDRFSGGGGGVEHDWD